MPYFYYKGINRVGSTIEGSIEAQNEQVVALHLQRLEIMPVLIQPKVHMLTWLDIPRFLPIGRPKTSELALFARQMHSLLKGGVQINDALHVVIASSKNKVLVNALTNISLDLESGTSLANCFRKQGFIFPEFISAMIEVGESTGKLEDVFLQIHHYLETESLTKKRIKSALRYPLIIILAICFAIGVINFLVVPAFKQFFDSMGAQLPFATQWLIQISDMFIHDWAYGVLIFLILMGGYLFLMRQPKTRYHWDKLKIKVPLMGSIIHRAILARFCRSLAMANAQGLPLLDAIRVVANSTDNLYITKKILDMRRGLEKGEALSVTAKKSGIFSPLVIQMMIVGEETGSMDENLIEIAHYYEMDVDYDIKQLNDLLEPALIAIIAVMVLILALGVFLPLWDLSAVAMQKIRGA